MGKPTWRCFHCDEEFTDPEEAAVHFGTSERVQPVCEIDHVKYREMERRMMEFLDEDTALHREIHRLHARIAVDTRRAEEDGYARGLADAQKHPEVLGLVQKD